jgi:DNA-binding beta-propeller fold protein YncE
LSDKSLSLILLAFPVFCAGCGNAGSTGDQPLLAFGRTGVGPVEFNYPRAAAFGPDGLLYIVDKGGRAQVLTQSGEFVRDWHMPEYTAGKPTGLGIAPDGRIYFADTHYFRVTVFRPDGTLDHRFGAWGDEPGQFRLPTDVAIDPRGFIYVSEYGGNDRVTKFTLDWKPVLTLGGRDAGDAQLVRPQSLCLAPDGTLWITDSCNHRIVHFDGEGRLLTAFGKPGGGWGELRFPYNAEVLSDGTLVVMEYGNNRVQRFDQSGKSLGIWGGAGRGLGQLAYPWALAVDEHDRVYLIDSGNNRVQVIDGVSAATWKQRNIE